MSEASEDFRNESTEFRLLEPHHHIDPGFINERRCAGVVGPSFVELFAKYKADDSATMASLRNDHLIVDIVLRYCRDQRVPPLGQVILDPKVGDVFCSTEWLEGVDDFWGKLERDERMENRVVFSWPAERSAVLSFGDHFVCDTGKEEQDSKNLVSVVGVVRSVTDTVVTCYPLIMGAPSFDHSLNDQSGREKLVWSAGEFFEIFIEDIEEFSKCKTVHPSLREWQDYMESCPEEHVKAVVADLLGEPMKKDWGGEQHDLYGNYVTLKGKRSSAAFAFKGPGKGFREMTMKMLGANADQIPRLATTTARLLVVQHCNTIGEAVRSTLRAFAVQPNNPRRYCLIDGRDTYRILKAYDRLSLGVPVRPT